MEGSESCSLSAHKRKKVVRCRLSVWSLRAVPWLSFAITDNRQRTTDNSSSSTDNRQQTTLFFRFLSYHSKFKIQNSTSLFSSTLPNNF